MAVNKGINNNNLKQENRGLILKMIVTGECNTRIELSKKTGLSKMSVSNIIGEFMQQRMITEDEPEKVGGQGRNPILLALTKHAPKVIGLDIHRSECVAVLSDLQLNVLAMARCPLVKEISGNLYEVIYGLIDEVMEGTDRQNILGIGVGGSGPVDIEKGMILNPPDFYGLRDLPVTEILSRHYGMPVYMDSQYNCAALAERYFGVGKSFHDFIFVGIMRGIGSGIVADEKIFRNANGFTSELGHVSIDWHGNKCTCGSRGCLETYAGSEIIREKLAKATGRAYSFREFCKAAGESVSPETDEIFGGMVSALACGLASAVNLLNPEAIIIGHEGYFIPDRYLLKLEEELNKKKLSGDYRHVAVLKSYFKEQAHILGCACPVLDRIFTGKMEFYS